jgi:hypothetical protein
MKVFKHSVTAAAVSVSLGLAVPAMAAEGYIAGNSVNVSGEKVDNVTVKIANVATGLTRNITTEADGTFRFPLLPPGVYSVEATKNGYQTVTQENVSVGITGKVNLTLTMKSDEMEVIQVTGSNVAMVDISSSSTGIVVDSLTMSKVPVARDFTGVALLAPGTTKGDTAFGNNPSIGGSSVAENAYYVNGLNITNFRTGVGSSQPPFEMYESFEVKTGGYSAEFGRVTGGVINAVTKSGTNEFKAGANVFFEPDAFRENKPSQQRADGSYRINNEEDYYQEYEVNLWASGAIIQDTLFFYALYSPRNAESKSRGGGVIIDGAEDYLDFESSSDTAYWGGKVDWYINDSNILEVSAFSDGNEAMSTDTNRKNTSTSGFANSGGLNYIAKYTSIITDDFSISAQYGVNETDRTQGSTLDSNPAVYSSYDGNFVKGGNFANFSIDVGDDKREVWRLDADWFLGDHELRFGLDSETLTATSNTLNSGGAYYLYVYDSSALNPDEPQYVRHRTYQAGGEFESKNLAFYIQDQWQATDDLIINMGLRNDTFENFNGAGESFVKLDNLWAARLGAVYDVTGDGESKLWASYGRYYLPVAANTNIRLSGAETYIQDYYNYAGVADAATETPNLTGGTYPDRSRDVFSDGDTPSTGEIVDSTIEPMYSDEFILGYQFQLSDEWSMGVQGTYRVLSTTIEDVAIDYGFNKYLEREEGVSCGNCTGYHYYVLTNPNTDLTITTDHDGLGDKTYTIPASDLGYPDAVRKYGAVDLTVERQWDDVWMFTGTYTWSHSWGNNEGYVRSDNGQDDAGLTTNFDQPGLTDYASGDLPNDRRHSVKMFGAYQVTENLNLGANFSWQSGKPKSAFGFHPTDEFAQAYGSESFFKAGVPAPRGSEGTTPSIWYVDLTASYDVNFDSFDVNFRADIFNVFNNQTESEFDEIYDDELLSVPAEGIYVKSENYGMANNWQTPRYVRLSASIVF